MKYLVLLLLLVLLVAGGLFLFGNSSASVTEVSARERTAARVAAAPRPDFSAPVKLLEQESASIPTALDAAPVTPTQAYRIKARLQAAPNPLPQYQTLAHACDLIIYAAREQSSRRATTQLSVGGLGAGNGNDAVRRKAQADWDQYRQQSAAEIKRLLDSLGAAPVTSP